MGSDNAESLTKRVQELEQLLKTTEEERRIWCERCYRSVEAGRIERDAYLACVQKIIESLSR